MVFSNCICLLGQATVDDAKRYPKNTVTLRSYMDNSGPPPPKSAESGNELANELNLRKPPNFYKTGEGKKLIDEGIKMRRQGFTNAQVEQRLGINRTSFRQCYNEYLRAKDAVFQCERTLRSNSNRDLYRRNNTEVTRPDSKVREKSPDILVATMPHESTSKKRQKSKSSCKFIYL